MFDIAAAKQGLEIENGKSEIQEPPRANRANRANPAHISTGIDHIHPEISTFSTFSTGVPSENENVISITPFYVCCIDCSHFEPIDHPHLGRCSIGVKSAAASSFFWSTGIRGCRKFTKITGATK